MIGLYVTFGADPFYWSVGLGAVAAYCLCLGAYYLETFVCVPWYYESFVGKPMVHWFSWAVFLDIIYHIVNPVNSYDCRKDFLEEGIHVLEENTKGEEEDFWLDFCADVGDGFNPTFAVFSSMAKLNLRLPKENIELPRADCVVVGGDICYPWPRHEDLMARFIRPLSWAYPNDMADRKRKMYVMPGNHEWADGLRNMRRVVLNRNTGMIGGWTVGNKTSYFAIKLPRNWWMFCVDPGSEAVQDMDQAQVDYFTQLIATQTTDKDRFIFAVHEPDWIKNSLHGFSLFKNMTIFRREVLGKRLRLSLAGDLHYYRRMAEVESGGNLNTCDKGGEVFVQEKNVNYPYYVTHKRQLIVAGHGGAFSHPTYVPDASKGIRLGAPHYSDGSMYYVAKDHPEPKASRQTFNTRLWLGFTFGKNYGFGSILAMSYIGMTLAVSPLDYSTGNNAFPSGLEVLNNASYMLRMLKSFWFYPSIIFMSIVFIVVATTSQALKTRNSKLTALFLSCLHIGLHVGSVLAFRKLIDAAWAEAILSPGLAVTFGNVTLFCFLSNTTMYLIGYFVAPFLTLFYLYLSQNVIGRTYYNEATSTFEYQEDKGFCRFRFTPQGDLELFSIGIEKTPRRWAEKPDSARSDNDPSHFEPTDVKALNCFLVERVLIKRDDFVGSNSSSSSSVQQVVSTV